MNHQIKTKVQDTSKSNKRRREKKHINQASHHIVIILLMLIQCIMKKLTKSLFKPQLAENIIIE